MAQCTGRLLTSCTSCKDLLFTTEPSASLTTQKICLQVKSIPKGLGQFSRVGHPTLTILQVAFTNHPHYT